MKVAIVGVTGYSGLELLRLLEHHPDVEVVSVHASQSVGSKLTELLPHLQKSYDLIIEEVDSEKIISTADLVFLATPSGLSKTLAGDFVEKGFPVIDLSGDFRLPASTYQKWYGQTAAPTEQLEVFTYGLSEWADVKGKRFIANPGCYATAVSLSLLPLMNIVEEKQIIVDAKSGLTGAGKKLAETSHFANVHENYQTYKLNHHQHIPEIMQSLKQVHPDVPYIQFSTSLLPINRGIVATFYLTLKKGKTAEDVEKAYLDCYQDKPFVRLTGKELPNLHQVIGSNFVDIGWVYNPVTEVLTVMAVLDNLVKGAAGQAIQNLNLMYGFPETAGLNLLPTYI